MSKDWGYSASNGPSTWHDKFPSAKGKQQSPVDITKASIYKPQQKLKWKYLGKNSKHVINSGTSWKVAVDGKGSELTGGPLENKYQLDHFHCHWGSTDAQGSEHSVNGKRYAGEMHLVHWNCDRYKSFDEAVNYFDGICVIGVFLKIGKPHRELQKIVSKLSCVKYKTQTVDLDQAIDPSCFIPKSQAYWTYPGSLTTPPCSECVIWIIFQDPVEVSSPQINIFRELRSYCKDEVCPCDDFGGYLKNNFRPTNRLNNREILQCRN